MEFLKRTNGAVFFVDILGFGALTQNQINLNDKDFSVWLDKYHQSYDNQVLAASILAEFREILNKIDRKNKNVVISQLSDCAFVWSENIKEVIIVANNIMSECINNGIFCRGGLSYGEILETYQNHKLGRFIVGNAVTEAVKLEGIAKGCRIMISQEFPHNLFEQDQEFSNRIFPLFQPFINPLDYLTYDEFKWYFAPFMAENINEIINSDKKSKIKLTRQRLKLANKLRLAPKFSWNAKSSQGLVHLRASINFIAESKDNIFKIQHEFGWEDVCETRSYESVEKVEKMINEEIR
ncbi:hypothetical protein [Flavobacterium psychrophilum]|uniref:hypothetical protein n=1 Tax=Flavobacterium psychrophilum TaxID=96345 RepID=UPI000B7C114D|nr:hypothetical protein [Flavobacterium psychrophilum]EKT4502345.1 hypothetical protein [Flavobacterium psychrophilum]MBF2023875.1 hypothetical protein [Flavobacterium psychrophilum]MCB5984086.1 hypothetical protein [Flavobacterium psychrophilum]MCB5995501.1 hypothetical protein [Flavobacterium psychrophilum]MCB5997946.1 hypothetical protein [Flavobacterium psychrophilum]